MPFAGSFGEGEQCVFCWGAGEDGQLCLDQAPTGEDEWHVAVPTVRPSRGAAVAAARAP